MVELARTSRFAQRLSRSAALELVGPVLSEKVSGVDNVLGPPLGSGPWPEGPAEGNPFVRYRRLLWSYEVARHLGIDDEEFVAMTTDLDEAVAGVDGRGFRVTPMTSQAALAAKLGIGELLVKDETKNVSGSHKARHLFGIAMHLRILERADKLDLNSAQLVIASCGNAALAAAVVARALGVTLRVFVPPSAAPSVLDRLESLGSEVSVCERRAAEQGDPSYLRFLEAVAAGGVAFCCQGPDNGLTLDGGRTIGFELADQIASSGADRIFVQVGGGALATGISDGLAAGAAAGIIGREPKLHAVQTEGAYPLVKAYTSVFGEGGPPESVEMAQSMISAASEVRSEHMNPWPTEPHSAAHGILDDETYDWQSVLRASVATGGWPLVATEAEVLEANEIAKISGIDTDHTGTAGLAGLLHLGRVAANERVVVLFTGARR